MTEKILIQKCLSHERTAQKKLVVLYGGLLMTITRRYVKDYHHAEEVCQNAFILAFRKISQFDENRGSFKNWISKITINCALEFLRSKKFYTEEITELNSPSINHRVTLSKLLEEDLIKMLDHLSPIQRTIFNLSEIEGYKFKEIAESISMVESTCRSHLHRAKKILAQKLEEHEGLVSNKITSLNT